MCSKAMWDTIEVFQQTYKYMICQSCCPEGALSQALALWLAITYAKICASPQAKAKAQFISAPHQPPHSTSSHENK